jgi:aspartate/methionine/tyrosine aminotransferase
MLRRSTGAVGQLLACHLHNGVFTHADNTYEAFVYGPEARHVCLPGPNIINIFSFSKVGGLASGDSLSAL